MHIVPTTLSAVSQPDPVLFIDIVESLKFERLGTSGFVSIYQ